MRRIFWKIIYTDSYWSVSEIHEIFGRYLLLYYYLSKVEYLRSGFVRLLCFERNIMKKRERAGHFLSLVMDGSMCMYARKVYMMKECTCAKESWWKRRNEIFLVNECNCKRHQKEGNETGLQFLLVGTNNLSWSHYKFTRNTTECTFDV